MKTKLLAVPTLLTVAVLGLSGCGSSDSNGDAPPANETQSSQTTPTEPATTTTDQAPPTSDSSDGMGDMVMIDIKDFMYEGGSSVQAGQMVMVTNDDSEAHTLTSDESGAFAVTVDPGKTATFTAPTKTGSYPYHCDFHANMKGSLDVG